MICLILLKFTENYHNKASDLKLTKEELKNLVSVIKLGLKIF